MAIRLCSVRAGIKGRKLGVGILVFVVAVFNDAIYGGLVVDRDYKANVDCDAVLRSQLQERVNLVGEY